MCWLVWGSIHFNSFNRFIAFLKDIFFAKSSKFIGWRLREFLTTMWTVGNVTKKSYCKLSVLKPIFRFPIDFIIPLTGKLQRRTFLITGHWMAHFSSVVGSNSPRHVMSYWSASYLNLPVNNDPKKKKKKERSLAILSLGCTFWLMTHFSVCKGRSTKEGCFNFFFPQAAALKSILRIISCV